jgi:branched-chain amino acid transport system substrate-binding protein
VRRTKAFAVLAAFSAVALLSTACSSDSGDGGDGGDKVIKIGFIGPLTGGLAPFGQGMKKSAQLAIDQANDENKVDGWTLELDAQDDAADAKQGAAAAQKLASDPDIAAVIGTLNSSVAAAVQPVLDPASIAQVSPANSTPSLTRGLKWQTTPKRPHANYFRVVTTDITQGKADADYAYNKLNKRKAVVIHDKKAYGQGLAGIFTENFEKLGGDVLETITINPGEGDYKSAVTKADGHDDLDLIFYGGEFAEAGIIAKNMGELEMKAPDKILMGGDGIVDKTYVKLGGAGAQGHYATSFGASAQFLPSAKQFVTDYKAKYNAEDFAIYGPTTYDSANIIIEAIAEAMDGKDELNTAVRKEIITAIGETKHEGALGTTTFDEFGDTTNPILTMNKVEGDDFKPLEKLKI